MNECSSQRSKLGVSPANFEILHTVRANRDLSLTMNYPCPYGVRDVASTTLMVLPGICDKNLQVLIFVEYLLDTAVIASLLAWGSLPDVFLLIVTQVPWPRDEFWGLVPG